jgi:hypothetical protein
MGLLGKANAKSDTDSLDIQSFIGGFHQKNPLFHCLLLGPGNGGSRDLQEIAAMSGCGIEYACLPDGNCLVLLPGGLDIGLFSHRFSKSSGSAVILQFSADSVSSAIEQLESNI